MKPEWLHLAKNQNKSCFSQLFLDLTLISDLSRRYTSGFIAGLKYHIIENAYEGAQNWVDLSVGLWQVTTI